MNVKQDFMLAVAVIVTTTLAGFTEASDEDGKPHVVLVAGTLHYSPELTMPVFAKDRSDLGFARR